MENNFKYLPEPAKRFYEYMTERNILFHYSSIDGIETVLTHLSQRIRNRFELQKAIPILEREYKEMLNTMLKSSENQSTISVFEIGMDVKICSGSFVVIC